MPNWISNYVEPSNDAAKAFTKKYLLNDDGLFCFGKLVPVPDIIDKITGSPSFVVSPEKFQAFKAEHQESVHCEYEQEGLLYTLDEDGEVNDAVCTAECSDHLRNKFGCDNLYDFHVNNWGTKWEAQDNGNGTEYDDNGDDDDIKLSGYLSLSITIFQIIVSVFLGVIYMKKIRSKVYGSKKQSN